MRTSEKAAKVADGNVDPRDVWDSVEGAIYDLPALCQRWGATEAQVLRFASPQAGVFDPNAYIPRDGRFYPAWTGSRVSFIEERYLPELAARDVAGAVERFERVMAVTDRLYPVPSETDGISKHALDWAEEHRSGMIAEELKGVTAVA